MNAAHPPDPKKKQPHEAVAGCLFILSAPSGAGKSTLSGLLQKHFQEIVYSISYTTRTPRRNEVNGRDYYFISRDAFEAGIKDHRWAEWALVHGHYYGTSGDQIEKALTAGKIMLMDIDVQGARQIKQRFPQAVMVFIMPPSLEELERRLRRRGTDSEQDIALRLKNAQEEMAQKDIYDNVIINDDLDQAAQQLIRLVEAYRSRLSGKC